MASECAVILLRLEQARNETQKKLNGIIMVYLQHNIHRQRLRRENYGALQMNGIKMATYCLTINIHKNQTAS